MSGFEIVYFRALNNNIKETNGKQIIYNGGTQFIDAKGDVIWQAKDFQTVVKTIALNAQELIDFREKFPVGMDGDDWKFEV